MSTYDYVEGRKRVQDILDNKLEVVEKNEVPSEGAFTFDNGYYCWVGAIFVDIRESTDLFSNDDKQVTAKIIRAFTSEIIEILRTPTELREIGIRGDCVYAIYTTPLKSNIIKMVNMAAYINTFMKMLNKMLSKRGYKTIKVGIGVSADKELVVKAGRKGVGINNNVWIGNAVTKASKLSSIANKENYKPIALSSIVHTNIVDEYVEKYGEDSKSWFSRKTSYSGDIYYESNIIISGFDEWINKEL